MALNLKEELKHHKGKAGGCVETLHPNQGNRMKAKKYLTTANTANTAEKHRKSCLIVPYLLLLYTYFFALIAGFAVFAVLKQVLD